MEHSLINTEALRAVLVQCGLSLTEGCCVAFFDKSHKKGLNNNKVFHLNLVTSLGDIPIFQTPRIPRVK